MKNRLQWFSRLILQALGYNSEQGKLCLWEPLIWWERQAMKWTMKRPHVLKGEAWGCITVASNQVRDDRYDNLGRNYMQAQSNGTSKS